MEDETKVEFRVHTDLPGVPLCGVLACPCGGQFFRKRSRGAEFTTGVWKCSGCKVEIELVEKQ